MSNCFWLGADGQVTECSEKEFLALIKNDRVEMVKFSELEPSIVDEHPEKYSFWGIKNDEDD